MNVKKGKFFLPREVLHHIFNGYDVELLIWDNFRDGVVVYANGDPFPFINPKEDFGEIEITIKKENGHLSWDMNTKKFDLVEKLKQKIKDVEKENEEIKEKEEKTKTTFNDLLDIAEEQHNKQNIWEKKIRDLEKKNDELQLLLHQCVLHQENITLQDKIKKHFPPKQNNRKKLNRK